MVPQRNLPPLTLETLQEHATDHPWLADQYERICDHIQTGLRHNKDVISAIQQLNVITAYVLSRPDYSRWQPFLYDALLHAMALKDDELQIQIWAHLGSIQLHTGNYQTARSSLDKALNRPGTDFTQEARFIARIGMLSILGIYHASDIEAFIAETLEAARSIDKLQLKARLHFALGLVYTHQARTIDVLGHGQIAYVLWHKLDHSEGKQRTLLMMAEGCRLAQRFGQSQRYLDLAGDSVSTSYTTALKQHQEGIVLLGTQRYQAAEIALQQALEQFETLDYPYLTAAAQHTLGIAQTHLKKFDEARRHLNQAQYIWDESHNLYQHANVTHALAYLAHQEGDQATAQALYDDALRLLANVAESPMTALLRQEIANDRADLP